MSSVVGYVNVTFVDGTLAGRFQLEADDLDQPNHIGTMVIEQFPDNREARERMIEEHS